MQTQKSLIPHGNNHVDEGETGIFSEVDARTGTSVTIYKGKDFDGAAPVYHVKVQDADGNMTEREVDITKIDLGNCDEVDMVAYSAHLSTSGQYLQAYLKFASAKIYAQREQRTMNQNLFQKTDWLAIVREFMQIQYDTGNLKGYSEYKKFLSFLQQ